MAAVHKQQLGRAIFRIVWCLFRSNRIEIPYIDPTISSCRRKVDGRVRGPGDLEDVVGVTVKGMEFEVELARVP